MGSLAPLGPVVPGRAGDVPPGSSRGRAFNSGSAGGGATWVPLYRWGLGMPGIGLADLLRRWGHLGPLVPRGGGCLPAVGNPRSRPRGGVGWGMTESQRVLDFPPLAGGVLHWPVLLTNCGWPDDAGGCCDMRRNCSHGSITRSLRCVKGF